MYTQETHGMSEYGYERKAVNPIGVTIQILTRSACIVGLALYTVVYERNIGMNDRSDVSTYISLCIE